jgi:Ca-activated chloride channel homolog
MPRSLPMLDETISQSATDGDEAGFGALATARGCLPLAAMDVSGRIDGLLAQVTVRQTFVNATDEPLEATYIFPLPDRGAVTGFRMDVAGRVVEGVLQERSQARRQYAQAIRQGHRASIAEEERPGVFTMRVGNLMPGDVATVQLTVVGALPYSDGVVTFRFPMVVAPRYIPGVPLPGPSVGDGTAVDTAAVPDASRISPPVLLPGFPNPVRLSVTIDLYDSGATATGEPHVSLHAVWEQVSEGVRRIILRPDARLDRDFILRFRLGGAVVQSSLSLHPDADGDEGTFALTVAPPSRAATTVMKQTRPRDVVFLLDRSGSMGGWKMVAARRATARMIDTLDRNDQFNVFAFDDRIEAPKWDGGDVLSRLIPASDRSRFRAVEFLSKLESRGGTEIAQPLDLAVNLLAGRSRDRDRILVLVTDGQVGNEDQVLNKLGARLEKIRVFTLGIDQAINEGFLRRLAERGQGGGSCELVESEDRLDAVMESIHRRIDAPVLTDVRLEASAPGFELIADSMDDRPPSLFAGSPVLLLGRYRGQPGGPVLVRAETPVGTKWREPVVPSVRDNPAIAAAWARGQVRRLEDQYAAGLGDHSALEKTIVATSLRFGVLCRFTAYVAVDRREVVNEGGEVHQVTQPVEMPAGWDAAANLVGGSLHRAKSAKRDVALKLLRPTMGTHLASWGLVFRSEVDSLAEMSHPGIVVSPSSLPSCPPPPSSSPPPADEFVRQAGFTRIKELGQDAHGTVYKARERTGRIVSILVLKTPAQVPGREMAKLEKQLTGLKHPAILWILKLITDAGSGLVYAVVGEYHEGRTLTQWLSQNGLPDVQAAARLVLSLAEALEYAGRKKMRHGLLAPEMIQIGNDGLPRITGFGLSQLGCGPTLPEPTAQNDVENLAAILRQLLAGMPQVQAELEVISRKQYATAGELAADLRKFLGVKRPGVLGSVLGNS